MKFWWPAEWCCQHLGFRGHFRSTTHDIRILEPTYIRLLEKNCFERGYAYRNWRWYNWVCTNTLFRKFNSSKTTAYTPVLMFSHRFVKVLETYKKEYRRAIWTTGRWCQETSVVPFSPAYSNIWVGSWASAMHS